LSEANDPQLSVVGVPRKLKGCTIRSDHNARTEDACVTIQGTPTTNWVQGLPVQWAWLGFFGSLQCVTLCLMRSIGCWWSACQ